MMSFSAFHGAFHPQHGAILRLWNKIEGKAIWHFTVTSMYCVLPQYCLCVLLDDDGHIIDMHRYMSDLPRS